LIRFDKQEETGLGLIPATRYGILGRTGISGYALCGVGSYPNSLVRWMRERLNSGAGGD